ncbi:TonB-dependent receptor [Flavisphingomonas formosensis]|uniref:TonB-dependent receptor n=1 Tax=Flavisphingomonas formosensis TaxID=861534 RepID=UPI0012F877E9|nr:TonB-dependent receptor [Sphingomonas formosensis]
MNIVFREYTVHRTEGQTLFSCRRIALAAGVAAAALLSQPAMAADAAEAAAAPAADSSDIIVTAQRREQNVLKVPLSVATFSQAKMDTQGIRQIDDIARLTPSLRFTRTSGVTGNNGANISIRNIASDVGAATTAIYIDDTPIQIRSVGYFPGNPYPRVFDLERVEVLRGPQGTLFGAGAEGGAVRFITPQPSFSDFSVYGRTEVSTTEHGAPSYEAGLAAGGPVTDKIAVRFSAWYRRDGGYIDEVTPGTNNVIHKDINSQDTYAVKAAISWRPIDNLTITPGIYYQNIEANGRNQYWEGYGNPSKGDYVTGHTNAEPSSDRFYLPSLKVNYDLGRVQLISNTSYFSRKQHQILDYANYLSTLRSGSPFGTYANKDATNAFADLTNQQRNFIQEVRIQSYNDDSLVDWTVGGYYSRTKQHLIYYSASGRIPGVISSGYPQYLGRYNLFELIDANDRQFAGYANVDIKPINGVKITLGGRFTHNKFDFVNFRTGPVNSGKDSTVLNSQKENQFTPKIGVTWQVDNNNMLYASASKGFRPGGAQPIVDPNFCATDLANLKVTTSPTGYKRDSLWSYEVGSKNSLFGGMLIVDANAYLIKWKKLQQAIRLPTCGFTFIGNLGNATGKGFDVSVALKPFRGFQIGGSLGYNHTTIDKDAYFDGDPSDANPGVIVRAKGQRVGGPPWSATAFAEMTQPISTSVDGYARVDYSFTGTGVRSTVPAVPYNYDASLYPLKSSDYVTVRVGAKFGAFDASFFVNNLTNETTPLARNHDTITSPLYYDESYRPRTYGLTLQARY